MCPGRQRSEWCNTSQGTLEATGSPEKRMEHTLRLQLSGGADAADILTSSTSLQNGTRSVCTVVNQQFVVLGWGSPAN